MEAARTLFSIACVGPSAHWLQPIAPSRSPHRPVLGFRTLAKARKGEDFTEQQSILKLFGSEAQAEAALHMLESMGPAGLDHTQRSAPPRPFDHQVFTDSFWERYLRTFPGTIAGGTSQIQRNIIAERVLGLPR